VCRALQIENYRLLYAVAGTPDKGIDVVRRQAAGQPHPKLFPEPKSLPFGHLMKKGDYGVARIAMQKDDPFVFTIRYG
jgi:hypothetical protein